jgi:hypothetical protein
MFVYVDCDGDLNAEKEDYDDTGYDIGIYTIREIVSLYDRANKLDDLLADILLYKRQEQEIVNSNAETI